MSAMPGAGTWVVFPEWYVVHRMEDTVCLEEGNVLEKVGWVPLKGTFFQLVMGRWRHRQVSDVTGAAFDFMS